MLATTRVHHASAAYRPPVRATPVDPEERLQSLDILRGLALVFMILVHVHQMLRLESTGLQGLVGWAIWIGVEQKAWSVFAMLFGAGCAILLRRLEARGARVVPVYLRRLAALFVVGFLIDRYLDFQILSTYAAWGLALLVVRRWSTRTLVATAAGVAMLQPTVLAVLGIVAKLSGTPLERPAWAPLVPDVSLALMLVGFLAVRVGVVDEPLRHTRLVRRWMLGGLLAWAVSWLVLYHVPKMPIPGTGFAARTGIGLVREQWLAFTYAGAVLLLLARRPALHRRLHLIANAGRMAFTSYVLQAATIWLLAKPLGIKLHEFAYVGAWIVLTTAIVLLSNAWLAHFRHGPLEWLWRMATYARREPLRREDEGLVALAMVP